MKTILTLTTLGALAVISACGSPGGASAVADRRVPNPGATAESAAAVADNCQPLSGVTLSCTDRFAGRVGAFTVTMRGNTADYANDEAGMSGELAFDSGYRPRIYHGYCRYQGPIGQRGTRLQLLLSPAVMAGSSGAIHEISGDLEGGGSSSGTCAVVH